MPSARRNISLVLRIPGESPPGFSELTSLLPTDRREFFERICELHLPSIETLGHVPVGPPGRLTRSVRVLCPVPLYARLTRLAGHLGMSADDLARAVVFKYGQGGERAQLEACYRELGGPGDPALLGDAVLRFFARSGAVPDATRLIIVELGRQVAELRREVQFVTKQLENPAWRDYVLKKPNVAELAVMDMTTLRIVAALRGVKLRRRTSRGAAVAAIMEGD